MEAILRKFKITEDQVSNLLTVIIFVLVGVLVFNYFKSVTNGKISDREQTSAAATEKTIEEQKKMTVKEVSENGLPASYFVKKGESLWTIAQEAYGSGYEWTKIYEENKSKLNNPGQLEVGMELTLPKIEEKTVEHKVVKGESLWSIAQTSCGNGFAWETIATQNKLENPRVIEPGLKLTFRCR